MKIGIFGGTFDPPHKGHINSAVTAAQVLKLDRLIVIPNAIPPHKTQAAGGASADDRLNMTRAAFDGVPNVEVSDIELNRGGKSYTVDTVADIKKLHPDAEIYLLMGTDMFVTLREWHEAEKLLTLIRPAVFTRKPDEERTVAQYAEALLRDCGIQSEVIRNDIVEISSTELRQGLSERRGREYLEERVYAYIIRRRLYGARPDFVWLREQAYSMLKPKRVPHVQGCEEEAARLALRWGADVEKAREAGILHDITKKLTLEEQLLLCEEYGIMNDTVEGSESKLLHAKTGAAVARARFGMPDDVCSAIRWHTTGRAGMTLLEKLIYLADYIEPTRDFEGLDTLRRLCYEDIDSALLLGLEMSITDMEQGGITPHIKTREAIDYLRQRSGREIDT